MVRYMQVLTADRGKASLQELVRSDISLEATDVVFRVLRIISSIRVESESNDFNANG